jgi:tRNA (cytidine/uridine-2'-O-)-methyltransferase
VAGIVDEGIEISQSADDKIAIFANGSMPTEPLVHVVLYQPDIPQNTGNIGRTCAAVGAKLWLIRPLGFQLDEKHLRRAGLDYWKIVDWEAVDSWAEVRERVAGRNWWALTKTATRLVWDAQFSPGDILLFGSETRGLPASILSEQPNRNLRLPMRSEVRSLNLASTVNTVVYEAVRQFGGLP